MNVKTGCTYRGTSMTQQTACLLYICELLCTGTFWCDQIWLNLIKWKYFFFSLYGNGSQRPELIEKGSVVQTDAAVCCSEQVMFHLSLTVREREKEGGGQDWRAITEMSYLHISKIHHRTAIKGSVNTVLHIERIFSVSSASVKF